MSNTHAWRRHLCASDINGDTLRPASRPDARIKKIAEQVAAVLAAKGSIAAAACRITLAHKRYFLYFTMGWEMPPPKMPLHQGVLTPRLTGPTSAGVLQRHKISRQSRISDLAPDRIKSVLPAEHTPYSRRLCLTSSTNRKRKYNTVCHVLSVLQTTFLDCQDYILHCCQTRTEARLPATCR